MTKADFRRFATGWMTAHAVTGSTPGPEALKFCFQALAEFDIDDVEAALGAHARNADAGMFPPKPADIVRHINGASESLAAVAWADFRQATRTQVMPEEEALRVVIRRMGGLEYLGEKKSRELDFMLLQFKALYLVAREPQRLGITAARHQAVSKS